MERSAGAGEGDCAVEVCAGSELQIEAGGLAGGDRSRKRASERECGCRVGENVQDLRGTWGASVTERVSLRGPEKMGGKSYARGAIGIGGDGGDGAAGGVDERVLELGSGEVARSSAARARAIARALEWRGAAGGERVGRESSVFCRGLEAPVQGTRVK